jgi:hypothetical protein
VRFIFCFLLLFPIVVLSQRETKKSRSELGVYGGGMYYIGDLNQTGHFKGMKPAVGALYRFNVHSRLALRTNILAGSYEASDANSKFDMLRNRNLSVQSNLYELASGLEFNYWPYQIGHQRYKATAYFLVEMGACYFNPKTEYEGDLVELQPLSTEGQGSTLSSKRRYSRLAFTMPIGLGFRFSLGKKVCINLEYGIRKTFTDYLDDVGADYYVNSAELLQQNGATAAALSDRSIVQERHGRRGNSTTKDWYVFTGLMITFKLGNPNKCFFEPY